MQVALYMHAITMDSIKKLIRIPHVQLGYRTQRTKLTQIQCSPKIKH